MVVDMKITNIANFQAFSCIANIAFIVVAFAFVNSSSLIIIAFITMEQVCGCLANKRFDFVKRFPSEVKILNYKIYN